MRPHQLMLSLLCAWLLWIPIGDSDHIWKLHAAYTFRATCLISAVLWDNAKGYRAKGRKDQKLEKLMKELGGEMVEEGPKAGPNRELFGQSWCLPVGVDPNITPVHRF